MYIVYIHVDKKDYYYLDDFIIPSSTIQNLDSIGKGKFTLMNEGTIILLFLEGNFGEVFKADYKPPNSIKSFEVAVKTLKCGSTTKHTARKEMLKEFAAMATMVHPNIVRLFGVVLEDDPWIVIEYFSLGDLKSYLMVSYWYNRCKNIVYTIRKLQRNLLEH